MSRVGLICAVNLWYIYIACTKSALNRSLATQHLKHSSVIKIWIILTTSICIWELWWEIFMIHDPVHEWTTVLAQH